MMAVWQEIERVNRRLDDSWLGDVLGGIAFAIMTIGLIWGAGLAQAVLQ